MSTATATHRTDESSSELAAPLTGRVQLALNVSDLEASVAFYSKLFGVAPAKRRAGYANFAITTPPLKLVLLESEDDARGAGVRGALNHLGVEVASPQEVEAASQRLTGEGLETLTQDATTCCYAVQDKVWVHDPDGAPWEVYTVLADSETEAGGPAASGTMPELRLSAHGVPAAPAEDGCC